MERLHKLFIYRKKLVRPYIEQLLKWMDIITYVMSALLIMTLVYEHGFLISFQEIGVINRLYHIVWVVFLVDTTLHLLLNYSDTRRKYRGLAWLLSVMLYLTLIPVVFHEPERQAPEPTLSENIIKLQITDNHILSTMQSKSKSF